MASPHHWKRIDSEPGPDLKLFRARFDLMSNPRNGARERMIVLEGADSVNVIALTPAEEVLFVRQYRFGIGATTLELPGGIIDPGESPQTAAVRELAEETGYEATSWLPLGRIGSNPVFMDSYIHHFLAKEATLTTTQQLDPGEQIELVTLPLSEVYQRLREGAFLHPHTISALSLFFLNRESL